SLWLISCAKSNLRWHKAFFLLPTKKPSLLPQPIFIRSSCLRIRLLRRMSGVEASIRIGMQNPGWWNPPVQDWGKSFPPHLGALAPADQNTLPEPAHAKLKDAQLSRVRVVLVITQHNLPEPCTDFGPAIM